MITKQRVRRLAMTEVVDLNQKRAVVAAFQYPHQAFAYCIERGAPASLILRRTDGDELTDLVIQTMRSVNAWARGGTTSGASR